MKNPAPYHFYIEQCQFENERREHGEAFFKIVIDYVVSQIAPNPLDSYSRDKLTAGITEIYSNESIINALKQRLRWNP